LKAKRDAKEERGVKMGNKRWQNGPAVALVSRRADREENPDRGNIQLQNRSSLLPGYTEQIDLDHRTMDTKPVFFGVFRTVDLGQQHD
jgi:hypothetical protein